MSGRSRHVAPDWIKCLPRLPILHQLPIRGHYPGHVITRDHSEARMLHQSVTRAWHLRVTKHSLGHHPCLDFRTLGEHRDWLGHYYCLDTRRRDRGCVVQLCACHWPCETYSTLYAGLRWKRDKLCHKSRDQSLLRQRWIPGTQLFKEEKKYHNILHHCDNIWIFKVWFKFIFMSGLAISPFVLQFIKLFSLNNV